MHRSFVRYLTLAMMAAIVAGCSGNAGDEDSSDNDSETVGGEVDSNSPDTDTQPLPPPMAEERLVKQGTLTGTSRLSVKDVPGGSTELMTLEGGGIEMIGGREVLAGPGASDIHIEIHADVGSTRYYGMSFTEPCVVSILEDGTVVVDKPNLEISTDDGKTWISQEITLEDEDVIALFPKAD